MAHLPGGTVTLLFTDIEGSTRLLQRVGERYPGLLEDHRRLLREAFHRHAAYEVKTEGDSFFVAFASAGEGAAAAVDGQRALAAYAWPEDVAVRVRMGLHTGEPAVFEADDVGLDVHRAARVMAAGHGGQVLVSQATRDALGDAFALIELGEHRLKDLLRPERLYQLAGDGLARTFPPLRTLGARPTNLPVQTSPLVGREHELAELRRLLAGDVRLLTLTGPGGIGKTRLALQLGADVLEDFESGVFAVSLAPVRDPELVAPTIAAALGLRDVPAEPALETLAAYVADRQLLLVLDTFERLVEAAPVLTRLLSSAPRLKLVVTSRERVRVAGERVFELSPLATDAAVALFVDRARALRPDYSLTDANALVVGAICRRLDGLPLAIELAASRTLLLREEALLERLDRSLALLTGGARDADERQRTLRGAIDWSHELLGAVEQRLFARLAVFRGGCRLDDAEAVCDRDNDLGMDVLDGLQSLLEKSLLHRRMDPDGDPRFAMLETIRAYAAERLSESGEADALRLRHAERMLAVAQEARTRIRTAEQGGSIARLEAEADNARAALGWTLAADAPPERARLGLELAGTLGRYWYVRGPAIEGFDWLERALAADAGDDLPARARALHALGILADQRADLDRAASALREASELYRALGDDERVSSALTSLGIVERNRGDLASAQTLMTESLRLRRMLGDRAGVSTTTCDLGLVALDLGQLDRARALFEESLAIDRELGDPAGVAVNENNLAAVALETGELERAAALLTSAMIGFRDAGDREGLAESLELLAALAARTNDALRAARLAGAATALRTAIGVPPPPLDASRIERDLATARTALGDETYAAEAAAGARLTEDEAVAAALTR